MKGGHSMTKSLPAKADINLLKKQAKKLLKQYRKDDVDAITTVNTLHPKPEKFGTLRDAHLVVARSYGFKGWEDLSDAVAKTQPNKERLCICDFCGRTQHEVRKLIAGPNVFICEICADLCIGIIVEEVEEVGEATESGNVPGLPHLESVIQKAREFHLPRKNSTPKKNSKPTNKLADVAELTIRQAYEKALDSGFSGVILVRYRGDIVLHEASGFANKGQKILNTANTVFRIGSITKQFTSALVMSLQEAGLLKVEDRLQDHFANLPQDKANITIHQLLTHTAGFEESLGRDTEAIGRDEYIERAWANPLEFAPGSKFQYSNVGYSIATAIAEIVSGQSYEAALKKHILKPALLNETGYRLPDWSNHTLAIGYRYGERLDEMNTWADDGPYWHLRGNGGLLTTAGNLLKWHDVLSGDSVLTASSIQAMQGRHVDQFFGHDKTSALKAFYGYGWVTEDRPEGVVHWHTGGNGYFYAFIGRQIDEDLVIIGFSNEGEKALDRLCKDLRATIVPAK